MTGLVLTIYRFAANANEDEESRSDSVCWVEGQGREGPGLEHCIRLLRGIAHELQATQTFEKARLVVQQAAQVTTRRGQGGRSTAADDG